ncbi:Hypothetical predicted protein [Cloeon dipterum]|uniref:Uncharacterized protein n=1 Tax=Cloeon dipterum TaxID=197152 RepID=A0A8S1C1T4_9INSE|nr:Hypothetical predicted protein [Cloeon dipterum]
MALFCFCLATNERPAGFVGSSGLLNGLLGTRRNGQSVQSGLNKANGILGGIADLFGRRLVQTGINRIFGRSRNARLVDETVNPNAKTAPQQKNKKKRQRKPGQKPKDVEYVSPVEKNVYDSGTGQQWANDPGRQKGILTPNKKFNPKPDYADYEY